MSGFLGIASATIPAGPGFGDLTLQLGDVIFDEQLLEVPNQFTSLGGDQAIAQHDYPGGTRTQQTFGAFPAEIQWSGILSGPTALDRVAQIDRIRVAAQVVNLYYGPKQWSGRVVTFTAAPRHQWLIHYNIRFLPLQDLTAPNPSTDPNATPEMQMSDQTDALSTLTDDDPFPMPVVMVTPTFNLLTATQLALLSANGIVDRISFADATAITAAATLLQATGAGVMTTGSSADVYMAVAAMNCATLIQQLAATHGKPNRTVSVVNPSLPALAAQYLGDASRWQDIAYVNGIVPADPFPLGSYFLKIPPTGTTPILT